MGWMPKMEDQEDSPISIPSSLTDSDKARAEQRVKTLKPREKKRPRILRKGKQGPERFEPTDEMRRAVELAVSGGIPKDQIAKLIINPETNAPISLSTLNKYFKYELDIGAYKLANEVNKSLLRRALGQDAVYDAEGNEVRPYRDPSDVAIIWFEKTRRGFKEGTTVEHIGSTVNIEHQTIVILPPNNRDKKLQEIPSTPVLELPKKSDGD